jgi:hypothetical protein
MGAMDLATFKVSLKDTAPPDGIEPVLQALWHEAHGDWDKAHRLAQGQDDARGAWAHAYLHRVEGDQSNAAYWYRRAGKAVATASLNEEWDAIVAALLEAPEP